MGLILIKTTNIRSLNRVPSTAHAGFQRLVVLPTLLLRLSLLLLLRLSLLLCLLLSLLLLLPLIVPFPQHPHRSSHRCAGRSTLAGIARNRPPDRPNRCPARRTPHDGSIRPGLLWSARGGGG
jgi:hypothetical protein